MHRYTLIEQSNILLKQSSWSLPVTNKQHAIQINKSILSLKIKPPKNYDLPLPLHGIIIYVITSNMHDNFIIIIYSND